MAESFQNEIPRARINITLDLETGGARKKKELPLKLLMMGDFSGGKTVGPVADRERINIDKNSFNQVLNDLGPELNCAVPNRIRNDGSELAVNLKFTSMADFEPDAIARQLPELQSLVAIRNLLKDLKSNLLDNKAFRTELEAILRDQDKRSELSSELRHIPSLDEVLPMQSMKTEQEEAHVNS